MRSCRAKDYAVGSEASSMHQIVVHIAGKRVAVKLGGESAASINGCSRDAIEDMMRDTAVVRRASLDHETPAGPDRAPGFNRTGPKNRRAAWHQFLGDLLHRQKRISFQVM